MDEIYKKLTEILKSNDNVIIMTHKNPDLDGMSSAVCLSIILNSFNKKSYIYIPSEIKNNTVNKMFQKLELNNIKINTLKEDNYKEILNKDTLLVVLDVNNRNLLENDKLYDKTTKTILIDHHIKPRDCIIGNQYTFIKSRLSSIAEFMTNYIKYLNISIKSIISTILLAAIEIDTNSFNIKTTEETYNTAAYLMKIGADNVEKQEILKENKDEYLKRQDLLKNSFMINNNTAICVFDNKIYKKEELAETSEQLLQFENVEVSYTIGKTDDMSVSISARSLGKINVEKIMKKFGGGGHLTEAAAEIKDANIKDIKTQLISEVI